jgi:hypothetical protein
MPPVPGLLRLGAGDLPPEQGIAGVVGRDPELPRFSAGSMRSDGLVISGAGCGRVTEYRHF